ncbi:MAG: aminopeptidase [Tissierellia bacterium]|nr:aminopeptidase [Tissierellia bacterium]MDD4439946.1 aminopeptidase [Tissierellia bacterium]
MAVKKDESVLILTDDKKIEIGKALYEEAKDLAKEAVLMVMKPRKVSGEEPPEAVAKTMKNFDVIICPTSTSITHTNAKINAVKNGARLGSMPGITEEMFNKGAITADYKLVENLTLKITDMLNKAKSARIEKEEYILEMSLEGRNGIPSTGVYREPGQSGNLPSGEAYIAPLEGTASGTMKIDGSMVGIGKLNNPLYVKISEGKLTEITGDEKDKVSILLENDRNATLGELGIGTNHAARLTGVILEDEKIFGTVHIAFGTNISFGGVNKADCHLDGVILEPTLYLDDRLIIEKGKFVV